LCNPITDAGDRNSDNLVSSADRRIAYNKNPGVREDIIPATGNACRTVSTGKKDQCVVRMKKTRTNASFLGGMGRFYGRMKE
jgi:hypothetical protein